METDTKFLSIRECAAAGPLSEFVLRKMEKQGKLPGFFSGTKFLVNYRLFLENLEKASTENMTV